MIDNKPEHEIAEGNKMKNYLVIENVTIPLCLDDSFVPPVLEYAFDY